MSLCPENHSWFRALRPARATSCAVLIFAAALPVFAQQAAPAARAPGASAPAVAGGGTQRADYIVAVINSEPITNLQVRQEMQVIARALNQQQRPIPDGAIVAREALERLINDRAQLHLARETGVKVDEAAVDEAEAAVARQNNIDVSELRRRMAADGMDRNQFRKQLRDQLMVMRVREREVTQRVKVTEADIDQYLRDPQTLARNNEIAELSMAHILIALPDNAAEAEVAAARTRIEQAQQRARAGEDFAKLARELSNASDASAGGELGPRPADRYPNLFLDAARGMTVGGLAIVRSGAGFHLLKLLDKRTEGLPTTLTQTRARHVLLRLGPQLSEVAARSRLDDLRERIVSGRTDFATAARENSQDASAPQGGDLGWTAPGQLVPEFQEVMDELAPGEVSAPLLSRFGMHLIKLEERRTVPLSERERRDMVRNVVRARKTDDAFRVWAQELRDRAYVDMREPVSY